MWPGQDGQPADSADGSANQGKEPGFSDAQWPGGMAAETTPAGTERLRTARSPSGSVWPDAPSPQRVKPASSSFDASWTASYDPLTGPRPRFIPKAELMSETDAPEPDSPAAAEEPGAASAPASTPVMPAAAYPSATGTAPQASDGAAAEEEFAAPAAAAAVAAAGDSGESDSWGRVRGGFGAAPWPVQAAEPWPVQAPQPWPVHEARPWPVQAAQPRPVQAAQPWSDQRGQLGPRRRARAILGITAAVAVVVVGGGTYLYLHKPSAAQAADHDHQVGSAARGPEHVMTVTPANGATSVNGAAPITVKFSEPLSATSPMPAVSPAIAGTWHRHGDTAVFVPARGFGAHTKVIVRIPGGSAGVRSAGGGLLAASVTATFRTAGYSTARIEQLLAQLGYLPLTWAPASRTAAPLSDARAQLRAAYSPPAGTYTWQSGWPTALTQLWRPAKPSEILRGAVMAFQADHGLTSDMIYENQQGLTLSGAIGHRLWRALFRAAAHHQTNQHGYTYALANQKAPETLTVWHDGVQIFKHLANTGIPVSPTAVRTDPVYLRYRHQIMKGRNPDGSKYADPVAWVAYFHGGEAVHYFPRYSYGSQQSLGCVELPWGPAKRIWPYMTFGTLVTVTAP
jgi:hypothetical protein